MSKLKKEREADKDKRVPKADKVVQTEAVVGRVAATQTPVHTYASVAAQVEEVSVSEGEPTDKMDIDPPGSPKSGKKPQSSQGGTPTLKPTQATPTSGHLARAFVVHGHQEEYHQEKNFCVATRPPVTCVMCLTNELRTRCTLST